MNLITTFEMINKYTNIIGKWLFSIAGGILAIFEPIQAFIFVCGLAIIGDLYTSIKLGMRVSKQHPDKASGKIQSSKIRNSMTTLLKVLFALYFAWQVDVCILCDSALYGKAGDHRLRCVYPGKNKSGADEGFYRDCG